MTYYFFFTKKAEDKQFIFFMKLLEPDLDFGNASCGSDSGLPGIT